MASPCPTSIREKEILTKAAAKAGAVMLGKARRQLKPLQQRRRWPWASFRMPCQTLTREREILTKAAAKASVAATKAGVKLGTVRRKTRRQLQQRRRILRQ